MHLLLPLLPLIPIALSAPTTAPAGTCAAVGIITARASTESPGEGIIGALAKLIQSRSTQTVSRTSVVYPAVLSPYAPSVASGVAALKQDIQAAVAACPQQKIVLLGYSQGAQVISDTLGGGGGGNTGGAVTPPIDPSLGSKVVAGILMGDPRYTTTESSFHVGSCKQDGIFPRGPTQLLTAYASLLKTYCDDGDPFCCSGNNPSVHTGYTSEYDSVALAFVLAQIGG